MWLEQGMRCEVGRRWWRGGGGGGLKVIPTMSIMSHVNVASRWFC